MNKVQARDPIRFDSFPTGIEKEIMARKLCECFMKFYEVPENRERLDRYAKELKIRKEMLEDEQNRAKRKAARAAAYEVICEGLCIAAFFPMTVGFIWLSESLERALMHFAASVILALSAAAFHLAADALYTEEVISNVVSAEVIRAVGASLRRAEDKKKQHTPGRACAA